MNTIEKILASIRISLKNGAYYSALISALTLPDICGEIDYSNHTSKDRYIKWFNKYLHNYYNQKGYKSQVDFLVAENCYALRCSLLHEGISYIGDQKAQQGSLRKIHFHTSDYDKGHCNLNCDNIEGLQLNVERFCDDVIEATRAWLNDISRDKNKSEKVRSLTIIHENRNA